MQSNTHKRKQCSFTNTTNNATQKSTNDSITQAPHTQRTQAFGAQNAKQDSMYAVESCASKKDSIQNLAQDILHIESHIKSHTESTQDSTQKAAHNTHYYEILFHVASEESYLQDIITQSIADVIAEHNDGVEFLHGAMINYTDCK